MKFVYVVTNKNPGVVFATEELERLKEWIYKHCLDYKIYRDREGKLRKTTNMRIMVTELFRDTQITKVSLNEETNKMSFCCPSTHKHLSLSEIFSDEFTKDDDDKEKYIDDFDTLIDIIDRKNKLQKKS